VLGRSAPVGSLKDLGPRELQAVAEAMPEAAASNAAKG